MTPNLCVVVDTNVVSLLVRENVHLDPLADYYRRRIRGLSAVISFQTVEELWFGAFKAGWGDDRKHRLAQEINRYEVVESSPELALISADLRCERERAGRRLETADAWIAATAILLKCPLVSHDGDFGNIPGLNLVRSPS